MKKEVRMRVEYSTLIPVGQTSKVSVDHNCHSESFDCAQDKLCEESRSYKKKRDSSSLRSSE